MGRLALLFFILTILAFGQATQNAPAVTPSLAPHDIRTGLYQGHPVTYEVIGGRAIYQGDIVLGNAADLAGPQKPGNSGVQRASVSVAYPSSVVAEPPIPVPKNFKAAEVRKLLEAQELIGAQLGEDGFHVLERAAHPFQCGFLAALLGEGGALLHEGLVAGLGRLLEA
jgi:hypothetical protein